jgi:hypothetical protein
MDAKISVKLEASNTLIRQPCIVCGGRGARETILAMLPAGHCVCRYCLCEGNIDERLRAHIEDLQGHIAYLESLVGRLVVPTIEEFEAASDEVERRSDIEAIKAELQRGDTNVEAVCRLHDEAELFEVAKRELAAAAHHTSQTEQ